jgi:hypothetical protein
MYDLLFTNVVTSRFQIGETAMERLRRLVSYLFLKKYVAMTTLRESVLEMMI